MARRRINLVPSTIDVALYAGDAAALKLTVADADQAPLNVTGVVEAQIRRTRDAETSWPWEVDLEGAADGVVLLTLSEAQTAELMANAPKGEQFRGVWDLQWTPAGALPVTLIQGTITCDADVTR